MNLGWADRFIVGEKILGKSYYFDKPMKLLRGQWFRVQCKEETNLSFVKTPMLFLNGATPKRREFSKYLNCLFL